VRLAIGIFLIVLRSEKSAQAMPLWRAPTDSSFLEQRSRHIQHSGTLVPLRLCHLGNHSHTSHSLLKRALELDKQVLFLNVGPTRADGLPGVDKLELPTSVVMTDVVHAVM
jgi:hypothetical protein